MINLNDVEKFAQAQHAGQKYGHLDYYDGHIHPVVVLTENYTSDKAVIAAAMLHDVVEDTPTSIETVRMLFGDEVADMVHYLTDPEGENMSRKDKKAALYWRFRDIEHTQLGRNVALVKCADRSVNHKRGLHDNSISKMKMYLDEFPAFMTCFSPALLEGGYRGLFVSLLGQFREMSHKYEVYS